jgi:hypothetical protein
MDLNYLLLREQIERVRADKAACDNSRAAHRELAECYRALIDDHRGAPGKPLPSGLRLSSH